MRFIFFALAILTCTILNAQEAEQLTIKTFDGQVLTGKVIKIDQDSVVLDVRVVGIVRYAKADVLKVYNEYAGDKLFTNVTSPYYLPTAIPAEKQSIQYQNYLVFGNEFRYTNSHDIEFSAGFETATFIFDFDRSLPLMQLGVKYGRKVGNKIYAGINTRLLFNDEGSLIQVFFPVTFGGRRSNLTVTPALLADSDLEDKIITIAGTLAFEVTRKVRLIADLVQASDFSLVTVVGEYTFENGLSLLGGVLYVEDGGYGPNIGLSLPIKRGN